MKIKTIGKCLLGVFGVCAILWMNKEYEKYKKEKLEKIIADEWMDSPDTDYDSLNNDD